MAEFAAGWLGGVAGVLASHPFDTLRTRQAVEGKSSLSIVKRAFQVEGGCRAGILSLYSGIVSPCVSVGCWKASTLGANYHFRLKLSEARGLSDPSELEIKDSILAACAAGSVSAAVCTPFEVIKSLAMLRANRVGTEKNSVIQQEAKQLRDLISRPGGSRNLLRGMHIVIFRDSYATGAFLGSYEWLRQRALQRTSSDILAGLLAGAVSGPIGWIVCYPVEVVRIHWMAAKPKRWHSIGACARELYHTGGVTLFFRGLPMCCLRSSVQISVTMMIYEWCKRYH